MRSLPKRRRSILLAIVLLAAVVLAPQVQASELLGGLLFTALSLGTVCLAEWAGRATYRW